MENKKGPEFYMHISPKVMFIFFCKDTDGTDLLKIVINRKLGAQEMVQWVKAISI